MNEPVKADSCFVRAYYLWQLKGFKRPQFMNEHIFEDVYNELEDTDLNFKTWSQEQLNQAREDLKKKWREIE